MLLFMVLAMASHAQTASVTLAWDPSPDTNVAGYNVYYGPSSGNYTNIVSPGNTTNVTVSGLMVGANYYFVATALSTDGLESDPSNEINYTPGVSVTNQVNTAPTLDAIPDVTITEDAAAQSLILTGITSGASNEVQTLSITAISSNPTILPNPAVAYVNPNTNGTLTLAPAINAYGNVTVTVTVNDGQASNNVIARSFNVTVKAPVVTNTAPTISLIPDQTIAKNQSTLPIPFVIGDLETPAGNLELSVSTSSTNLVPPAQIVFGGTDEARTVTITPQHGKIGTALIGINVSDGLFQTQTTFKLTVSGTGSIGTLAGAVGTNEFRIISITAEQPGDLDVSAATEVEWESTPGTIYHILRITHLDDAIWTDLSGDILADGTFTSWIDGTAALDLPRFYRVMRVQ
jgi:hypothetical protein